MQKLHLEFIHPIICGAYTYPTLLDYYDSAGKGFVFQTLVVNDVNLFLIPSSEKEACNHLQCMYPVQALHLRLQPSAQEGTASVLLSKVGNRVLQNILNIMISVATSIASYTSV